MTENKRVLRFDFSGDEPKLLGHPPVKNKKTISKEHREAIKAGQRKQKDKLTPREKRFCEEYIKTSNGGRSVMAAGYNVSNMGSASVYANELLKTHRIQREIERLLEATEAQSIADAREVMQYFTDVMRGKVKDQFGLEASLAERSKAAQEIAKRTIDIDNRVKAAQQGDNVITIKLDWDNSTPVNNNTQGV